MSIVPTAPRLRGHGGVPGTAGPRPAPYASAARPRSAAAWKSLPEATAWT
jgi:hypothetical protein